MRPPADRILHVLPMFVVLVWGCSTPAPEPGSEKRAPDPSRTASEPGSRARGEPLLVAELETVLMAHRIDPGESLAVRLLGTIGPDGSYALESVDVRLEPGRVVLVPRVRRVPGDFFTQALVPLDHTTRVQLPAGSHVVEVRSNGRTLTETVRVEPGAERPAPRTAIVSAETTTMGIVRLEIEASPGDGFIERVELREWSEDEPGSWRPADSIERTGAGLRAWVSVRRPPGDAERRLEVRCVDGQGQTDHTPAVQVLPPIAP